MSNLRPNIYHLMCSFISVTFSFTATALEFPDISKTTSQVEFNFDETAVIYGRVYNDANGDGVQNENERGMPGVTLYLDQNNNFIRDDDEKSFRTHRGGHYGFVVKDGDYIVRQDLPLGLRNVSGGEGENIEAVVLPPKNNFTSKIIGGKEVPYENYPFMAGIARAFVFDVGEPEYIDVFCGGALISDRWVLTAAHCVTSLEYEPETARIVVGTNNVDGESGLIIKVDEIIKHAEYDDDNLTFDIALLKLSTPIDLEASGLQTIGMLSRRASRLAKPGVLATTAGWGKSSIDSLLLQDLHIPIMGNTDCATAWDSPILDNQICAGIVNKPVSSCVGDSGGPLFVRDNRRQVWRVAGITSYGDGRCLDFEPQLPTVYTRVSEFIDWIENYATEKSRTHAITIAPFQTIEANFGNQSTLRSIPQAIEPRFQLVDTNISEQEDGYTFNLDILDEAVYPRALTCALDIDGEAAHPPLEFDCYNGENVATVAPLEEGIYPWTLEVKSEETGFLREGLLTLGTPPETTVFGSFTEDDVLETDIRPWKRYTDYYDITDLSYTKPIILKADSEDITSGLFMMIYDVEKFEQSGGSEGVVHKGSPDHLFVPENGIHYRVRISARRNNTLGGYSISIVNDGSLQEVAPVASPEPTPADLKAL